MQKEKDRLVQGEVEPGFELVRQTFVENFATRGELGAACAAYCGSRQVVNLWGGIRDDQTGAKWEEGMQAKQWKCPKCQTDSSWYTMSCANCGTDLSENKKFNNR